MSHDGEISLITERVSMKECQSNTLSDVLDMRSDKATMRLS